MNTDSLDSGLTHWDHPLAELRRCLDENRFTLLCQPIRELTAAEQYPLGEILVRLREEEEALLPPGDFFPVLEHYNLMPELDRWVVRHTAQVLAAGCKIPRLSVNVSSQTLRDKTFPQFVRSVLQKGRIEPGALLFEIDETDALARVEDSERFAAEIHDVGCGIMLDGFGRKAISFAPLQNVRADLVKVDGSIVRRVLTNTAASNKLKAMIRVCQGLGIGLVAECVETQDVLVRLKALGVTLVQGFGILQPHSVQLISSGRGAERDK